MTVIEKIRIMTYWLPRGLKLTYDVENASKACNLHIFLFEDFEPSVIKDKNVTTRNMSGF